MFKLGEWLQICVNTGRLKRFELLKTASWRMMLFGRNGVENCRQWCLGYWERLWSDVIEKGLEQIVGEERIDGVIGGMKRWRKGVWPRTMESRLQGH